MDERAKSPHDLRKVFCHYRVDEKGTFCRYYKSGKRKSTWQPGPRGGATECFLVNGEGEVVGRGVSSCSDKDAFCYKTGARIALVRAIYNFLTGKEHRRRGPHYRVTDAK